MGRINVDISEYERDLSEYAEDAAASDLRRVPPDQESLVERVREILGPDMPRPGSPGWARDVHRRLDALLDDAHNHPDPYARRMAIMDLGMDLVYLGREPKVEAERTRQAYRDVLEETRAVARTFGSELRAAVGRIANWGGSDVSATVESPFDTVLRTPDFSRPAQTFHVKVGRNDAGFTVFSKAGKVEDAAAVDDVLEGGDADFFDDPREQADYFNLVKELRHPGSSARGKFLVLWTARPVKDRARYERAKSVPPNIFVTTDPDRAIGLAQEGELGGGVRDIWRVVINEANLVQTLDHGRVKDYQVVGDGPVPVRSLDLTYPAPDTASGRVAARWRAGR